jgi:plasmid replication initiation protein
MRANMKKDELKSSVIKSNLLIESRYSLKLSELKLLLWMIKEIDINDKDFHEYTIYIKSFMDASNIKRDRFYSEAKKITKGFLSKVLELKTDEGDFLQTHFMSSVLYKTGQGYITYRFDPSLKPHLIRLQKSFSRFSIDNVINMKSVYSVRLYQLLKSHEGLKTRKFTIDELKYILVIEDKYKLFGDFQRYVLKKAQTDCIKFADITFDYSIQKKGRKAHSITFTITEKKQMKLWDGEDFVKNTDIETIDPKIIELEQHDKEAEPPPKDLMEKMKPTKHFDDSLFDMEK